jgi:hypothetical protein
MNYDRRFGSRGVLSCAIREKLNCGGGAVKGSRSPQLVGGLGVANEANLGCMGLQ